MESKAPPHSKFDQDEGRGSATLGQGATQRLLQRIADALQVPASALYRPPNAIGGTLPSSAAPGRSDVSDHERLELLAAFGLLRNPRDRQKALQFVREMAERD